MSHPMSASDQVYGHVRELILDGGIGSGELITEGQFVEATGLSRTPVREAFLRLEAEGWLKLYPKRGALVVPVQPEEKEQVLEARQLIETHAMTIIAASASAAKTRSTHLLEITERTREAMEADDIEAFTTLDAEFHLVLVKSSGNDILSDFYRGLRDRLGRMTTRSVWNDRTRMEAIVKDCGGQAEIVARRDVEGFSARLIEHMRATHDRAHSR